MGEIFFFKNWTDEAWERLDYLLERLHSLVFCSGLSLTIGLLSGYWLVAFIIGVILFTINWFNSMLRHRTPSGESTTIAEWAVGVVIIGLLYFWILPLLGVNLPIVAYLIVNCVLLTAIIDDARTYIWKKIYSWRP